MTGITCLPEGTPTVYEPDFGDSCQLYLNGNNGKSRTTLGIARELICDLQLQMDQQVCFRG